MTKNKEKDKYQKEKGVLILFTPDDFIGLPIGYLEWKKLLEDMREGVGDLNERDCLYGFDGYEDDDDDDGYHPGCLRKHSGNVFPESSKIC